MLQYNGKIYHTPKSICKVSYISTYQNKENLVEEFILPF